MITQSNTLRKSTCPRTRMMQRRNKLFAQVRDPIRLKRHAFSAERTYVHWAERFIIDHDKQNPTEMAEKEISNFVSYLALEQHIAALTQKESLSKSTACRAPTQSPAPHQAKRPSVSLRMAFRRP